MKKEEFYNIDDQIDDLFFDYFLLEDPTPNIADLYHYTTFEGAKGILGGKSISLRFTRWDCFADSYEGKFVLDVYQDVCKYALSTGRINNEFYKEIIDVKPHNLIISNDLKPQIVIKPSTYYICCLSTEKDSEKLWNHEDRDIQFNIQFKVLFDQLKANSSKSFAIKKVLYDSQEQKNLLLCKIDKAYNYFCKEKSALCKIKWYLSELLDVFQFVFKKSYYDFESEYRIIYRISEDEAKQKSKVKFYKGRPSIYIEIPNIPTECVAKVFYKPKAKEDILKILQEKSMEDRLEQI